MSSSQSPSKRNSSQIFRKVFVTVGTTEFDSLIRVVSSEPVLKALEALGCREIALQIGKGKFEPQEIDSPIKLRFFRSKESIQIDLSEADLVIGHAGAGTCLEALELRKSLVVVINETLHDNHQLELASQLAGDGHIFYCVPETLEKTLKSADFSELKPWTPGNPKIFVDWLDNYLGICFGGPDVYKITAEERAKHDQQFFTLGPQNGLITGEQARGFFMKSGLPSNILAQIWGLADMNKDGKMDKKEFSIAMGLIQKKLKGFSVPQTLPEIMKQDPLPAMGTFGPGAPGMVSSGTMGAPGMVPMGGPGITPLGMGMGTPGMGTWHGGVSMQQQHVGMVSSPPMSMAQQPYGMVPIGAVPSPVPMAQPAAPPAAGGRFDWSMTQHVKLKHSQLFNNLDKGRIGSLTGVHARNILSQSGLPNPILAQIWGLADVDKDGKLTCDEFCIAMHLVDMAKIGHSLPAVLPESLLPGRVRSSSVGAEAAGEEEELAQKKSVFASFEDKRKHNFDKGQAELERRRLILLEQENKEKEARERKEREEFERRERERLEKERRMQLEYEKQMAKQREIEMQRQEEQRKMLEQREAARRELDKQRQQEWERQRIQELTAQRQKEQEGLCHVKQKQKNLTFQLQALGEKSLELSHQITDMRQKIVSITGDIEVMKKDRDMKLSDIERLKMEIQNSQVNLGTVGREKQLIKEQNKSTPGTDSVGETLRQVMHSYHNKEINMEKLKASLTEVEKELKQKREVTEERQAYLSKLETEANEAQEANNQVFHKFTAKQNEARKLLQKHRSERQNGVIANNVNHDQQEASAPIAPWPAEDAAAWPATEQNGTSNGFGSGFDDNFAPDWGNAAAPGGDNWGVSGDSWGATSQVSDSGHPSTLRYRGLYEFKARSDDELSFQPGDIILVFKDHAAEPGWLAGQIRDKVGWFPSEFAECLEDGRESSGTPTGHAPAIPDVGANRKHLDTISEHPDDSGTSGAFGHSVSQLRDQLEGKMKQGSREGSVDKEEKGLIAEARYNWKGKGEKDLSFSKGDRIKVLEQNEMLWVGELNGKRGTFPKSYVKLVDGPRRRESAGSSGSRPPSAATSVASPTEPKKDFMAQPGVGGPGAKAEPVGGEWYVSSFPFEALESGDLQFGAGERILIIQKDGDWWTGQIGDRTGIFPANYVQIEGSAAPIATEAHTVGAPQAEAPVPATAPPETVEVAKAIAPFAGTARNQLTLQAGDMIRIHSKSPTGWWEGELQKKGQDKQSGWFPGNYVKVLGKGTSSQGSPSKAGSISSFSSAQQEEVRAIYDYAALQDDELSFSRGEAIIVTEKVDDDWWRGKMSDGKEGLFPASYVQASLRSATPQQEVSSRKLSMHKQEMIDTEANYIQDLTMVVEVFRKSFISENVISEKEAAMLFVNWNELINVAKGFLKDLNKNPSQVGDVIMKHLNRMKAFVRFCEGQKGALDFLEQKEKASPSFRAVYQQCCRHRAARGLPLSYFLLLPMTRVTKYPLMIEKLIKYSDPGCSEKSDLEMAYNSMKELCSNVNQVVSEVENLQMLYWCQDHVKVEAVKPKLVFHSPTNAVGGRTFIHSGILYKAKSNRLLVGILFNDFLILTTPDEQIDHPDSFKLSRNADLVLSLYKSPILLRQAALQIPISNTGSDGAEENRLLALNNGEEVITFKAVSSNARMLWYKQLEKAIGKCKESTEKKHKGSDLPPRGIIGRLLVELVCFRQVTIPQEYGINPPVIGKMKLNEQTQVKTLDISKRNNLCTTQFVIESKNGLFTMGLFLERDFAPDLCIGIVEIPLQELLKASGHRGPILRPLPLTASELPEEIGSQAILKFVVLLDPD